jgi:hypothetical protein
MTNVHFGDWSLPPGGMRGYDDIPDREPFITRRTRIARKEHTCDECNTIINKGEKYDDDLDDEGMRVSVGPVREAGWLYHKAHQCCYMGYSCKHLEER